MPSTFLVSTFLASKWCLSDQGGSDHDDETNRANAIMIHYNKIDAQLAVAIACVHMF